MLVTCDCSATDYDANRCYSEVERKARKPHTCCECGDVIKVGHRYEEATGITCDGGAFRYRTCIGCRNLRRHYCPHGWLFGELRNALMDCDSVGFDYTLEPDEIPQREGAK